MRGGRKEAIGGGLDAVRAAAEVHRVEIALEDLVFGEALFDLVGERGFAQLPVDGALAVGEHRPHVLLGDRRAALFDGAGLDVALQGAADGAVVDAVVVVEPVVLDGDDGVADVERDLGERDRLPVLAGIQGGDQAAVGGEDLGGLRRRRDRVQIHRICAGGAPEHRRQDREAPFHHTNPIGNIVPQEQQER